MVRRQERESSMGKSYDAVIVGSGPNGLAAAITLAKAGLSVLVLEAKETFGGGCRTAELTLPGFAHDVCAAIHPMAVASPFFASLDLKHHGLEWTHAPIPLAHPLPDGSCAALYRSLDETANGLGRDGEKWIRLLRPFLENASALLDETLRPMRGTRHPLLMTRFGLVGLRSCRGINARFAEEKARALFAGCAAHSFLPLDSLASGSFGLMLALTGHVVGWPCAKGGSQRIIDALAKELRGLGGDLQSEVEVRTLRDLPECRAVLFDTAPRNVSSIASNALPADYRQHLERFKHGPGVFKVDWALNAPIPWRNPECARASTIHVGGTFEQIAEAEAAAWTTTAVQKPFVLVAQQSRFDPTRAPVGKQTAWAYCHVPHGSEVDMTDAIESRIEEFAPGFRDTILARHSMAPSDFQTRNANMIGGDISGGANSLWQLVCRPVARWDPYSTPNPRLFICSSSTPPGGGVHGMCGYWAAQSVLRRRFN
jgi:phytoene dehydrogenase-like protein